MKKDQKNDNGNIGGVLVGALIGFAAGLFLKEEDRQKIVDFLGVKTKMVTEEGKALIQNAVSGNISDKQEKTSSKKRLFSKRG